MLQRMLERLVHEFGNGRAVANAERGLQRDDFMHERIDALARRLPPPPSPGQQRTA